MATAGVSIIPNATAKTEVWEHFGYPGNESGGIATKSRVTCCHSKKNMPYKNNTTNLYRLYVHLDHHHKEVYMKLSHYRQQQQSSTAQNHQLSLQETVRKTQSLSRSSERYKNQRTPSVSLLFSASVSCKTLSSVGNFFSNC